ncbi:Rmf/CrpP family protein [Ruegeria sp. ANG-R]|uniref:ribosome modulation factor n=1 Tax=Ruegeria sp. ANG-R TaxID=1577903 RepID=UPI00126A27E8|nr:Rmf/CrpP family protein [Ruegeria sp. ANG-R]
MKQQTVVTPEDREEAKQWGMRAGNSGLSPAVCPYSKSEPLRADWMRAYTLATRQRISHGGASPI